MLHCPNVSFASKITTFSSAVQNDTGICSNASNVSPADGNAAGCDTVVDDPRGDGINCDAVKQRCDTLKKEPFASCRVDVAPYISACSRLLCNYTDTDGLFCHLLDAYARVCRLKDWMDTVGCSASGCHEHKCIDGNEFCGLSVGGEPKCFCRSSYAAPFRAQNTLGDNTMCASKSASVSLVGCLLEERGVDISSLHLNDPSCSGVHDPNTNRVTFTFSDTDNCAANVSINGNKIVYSNTIMSNESSGIISRDDQLYIEFSCAYVQPQVQTMSFKILDSSVVKVIDAGEWTYVFNMMAFTDGALTSAVDSSSELTLDQEVWVQAKASDVDEKLMALVIDRCWATPENNPNANMKYNLIKNGCPGDDTVAVVSNGASLKSVFSFRVFQFVGSEADVFLHCDTKLCLKSDGCTKGRKCRN
ncbi:alpha-tectorin-like [Eucyclogobius newberryi]|uniref:alpha-tectorin-like n=1 Tax=Eucyclogobius newberryi TaxID=166745 RepID=UPI003B58E0AC